MHIWSKSAHIFEASSPPFMLKISLGAQLLLLNFKATVKKSSKKVCCASDVQHFCSSVKPICDSLAKLLALAKEDVEGMRSPAPCLN